MMIKSKYEAPELEVFELQVEKGFAQSSAGDISPWTPNGDYNDENAWGDE